MMLTAKDIQSSILEAAIEGKLTDRSSKDTPVNVTLCEVATIRSSLINQKKIKKVVAKDDDIPSFNIPPEWEWVRLSDIGELARGKSKHRPRNDAILYTDGTFPLIQTGDVASAKKYITQFNTCYNEKGLAQSRLWKKGTLCITIAANIGDVAILTFDACFPDSVLGFLPFSEDISIEYVYYMLLAYKQRMNVKASKVAQSNLSLDKINTMFFPLPPIEEQKRIVDRVNELLEKVDEFEKIEQQLTVLKANFPGDMRAAILQAAMQGKLTKQLENDSLVERFIELQCLQPFICECDSDIPQEWRYLFLEGLSQIPIKRGKTPKYACTGSVLVFAQKCNTKYNGISLTEAKYLVSDLIGNYGTEDYIRENDIVINSTGHGTLGRIGFIDDGILNGRKVVPDTHITVIRTIPDMLPKFLYYFLNSIQSYLESEGSGSTNQTELKADVLKKIPVPVPPIEEQQRIVERLDKLLPLCDELVE